MQISFVKTSFSPEQPSLQDIWNASPLLANTRLQALLTQACKRILNEQIPGPLLLEDSTADVVSLSVEVQTVGIKGPEVQTAFDKFLGEVKEHSARLGALTVIVEEKEGDYVQITWTQGVKS